MVPAFINVAQADTSQFSSVSNNIWSYEGDSHFNNFTSHNKAYNFLLSPLINGVVSPELAKKNKEKKGNLPGQKPFRTLRQGVRQGDKDNEDNWKNGLFGLRLHVVSQQRLSRYISGS